MLPFLIGTAIALGIGIAIYIHQQENEPYSFDNGSRSANTKSQPSNRIKNYRVQICAICQEHIGSLVATDLKCGHSFHTDCLADLIKHHHKKCPYCEHDIEIRNN